MSPSEIASGAPPRPTQPALPSRPAFAGGAIARGVLGLAFACAAFALAWLIETVPLPTDAPRTVAPSTAGAAATRELRVESTYAVATDGWSVSAAGAAVAGRADDGTWSGGAPAGELVITATPADAADGRLHGLRARLRSGDASRDLVAWGSGAVTLVVPAAAP
jgi:hypothetical protein